MGELSPWHWAVVIVVTVLLFGAKRLPDAARSLGRSARILRAELHAESPATDAAPTSAAAAPVVPPATAPVAAPTAVGTEHSPG